MLRARNHLSPDNLICSREPVEVAEAWRRKSMSESRPPGPALSQRSKLKGPHQMDRVFPGRTVCLERVCSNRTRRIIASFHENALSTPSLLPFPRPSSSSFQAPYRAILHTVTKKEVSPSNFAVAGEASQSRRWLDRSAFVPYRVAIGGRLAGIQFFRQARGFACLNSVNARLRNATPRQVNSRRGKEAYQRVCFTSTRRTDLPPKYIDY